MIEKAVKILLELDEYRPALDKGIIDQNLKSLYAQASDSLYSYFMRYYTYTLIKAAESAEDRLNKAGYKEKGEKILNAARKLLDNDQPIVMAGECKFIFSETALIRKTEERKIRQSLLDKLPKAGEDFEKEEASNTIHKIFKFLNVLSKDLNSKKDASDIFFKPPSSTLKTYIDLISDGIIKFSLLRFAIDNIHFPYTSYGPFRM